MSLMLLAKAQTNFEDWLVRPYVLIGKSLWNIWQGNIGPCNICPSFSMMEWYWSNFDLTWIYISTTRFFRTPKFFCPKFILIQKRKRILVDTVSTNKNYAVDTVSTNKKYAVDTVSTNKKYAVDTVSQNKNYA